MQPDSRPQRRVRVNVPRLPGHVVEFGLTGPVTLIGPTLTYVGEAVDDSGANAATVAAILIADVAGGRLAGH